MFKETGRICVDLKEMKVNSVTAVFAASPMGSVQSTTTHHMQTVVFHKPANTNARVNTNRICSVQPSKNRILSSLIRFVLVKTRRICERKDESLLSVDRA